jgi:hypothetical protein
VLTLLFMEKHNELETVSLLKVIELPERICLYGKTYVLTLSSACVRTSLKGSGAFSTTPPSVFC